MYLFHYKGTTKCIVYVLLSAGGEELGESDQWQHFAVIKYDDDDNRFVFSRKKCDNTVSYICQLPQQGLLIIPSYST